MVVENDPETRDYLLRVLTGIGSLDAVPVDSAPEALALLDTPDPRPWRLLVAGLDVPGMSGLELGAAARARLPGLPSVVLCTRPLTAAERDAAALGAVEVVSLPVSVRGLLAAASRGIARASDRSATDVSRAAERAIA
jgi:CheY-like chemotaxis protein